MRELNEMQQLAADTTDGHVLVLAGAGTGKTTVLTERAMRLIESHKAKPYQILSITFTNKAAREMMERIHAQAGDIPLHDMWTCTFHSMCVRILRMYPTNGYTSGFSIYDADDSLNLIRNILKDLRIPKRFAPSEVKSLISSYKNSVHAVPDPGAAADNTGGYKSLSALEDTAETLSFGEYAREANRKYTKTDIGDLEAVFAAYQSKLMAENAMDFDDLLLNALRVLLENERARTSLQKRFRYVMVDEYQDTNPVQYRLVRILSAGHGNLFCVGDDDQSIYGFRGADVGIIRRFEEDFPDAKIIRLEQNYRSTNAILQASNAVIANNADRFGKELWSENGTGDLPRVVCAVDDRDEAAEIAAEILERYNDGEPYSSNAVLYRMHSISRPIEEEMVRSGIPYRVYGGISFYARREIKDILAYLWIIVNPRADQQLLRIINVPARRIGPTSVAKIQSAAAEHGVALLDAMRHAREWIADPGLVKKIEAFMEVYDDIADGAMDNPVHETIEKICRVTGYNEMWSIQNTDEAQERLDNIGELISAAAEYDEENGPDLAGFMENVSLMTDQDTSDKDADAVTLMTVHAAKGLEFDNVYIAGLADEIFPSFRAIQNRDIEEERRLCYVALTRAKKHLTLLTSGSRFLYGQHHSYRPSQFLAELPPGSYEGDLEHEYEWDFDF